MKASPNPPAQKAPQSRGMSASLRRLAARRVAQALSAGALLAFGAHAARSQGIVPSDIQYTFQTSGGTFSTGFSPAFTGDINGQLNFGAGITAASDDLATASVNSLAFNNTGNLALTSSAATNVLTLTTNSAGILPSIYVGTGPVTIGTTLAGTSGFVKTGAGALTLQTNADTFTGTATVNQGTLNVNVGQNAAAAFAINNGATLATNQALPATIFITALSGTSTFNSTSGSFAGTLVGNGNLSSSLASATGVNQSLLFGFGGTISFTDAPSLRIIASTTGGTFSAAYATVDFGSLAGSFYSRDAAQVILGGASSTSATASLGTQTNGGAVGVILGSANGAASFNGVVGGGATTSVTKVGTGTQTLTGLNTYTGATSVNGGTLQLNYSTNASNILAATSPLTFGGGTLSLLGQNSAATTQTMGATTVGQGGGRIVLAAGTGTVTTGSNPPVTVPASTTLTLGTLTATAAGGALNISAGANTSVTTTTAPGTTGTYGGRVTFTDATGATNWATSASIGTPFTLSGYTGYAAINTGGGTDTNNSLVTDGAVLAAALTTNSLKATDTAAGNTLDLGTNTLTLTNGGLLFTGPNAYTITDGTLASGTSAATPDLIVSQFGAGNLTIGATISNGAATGAGTLTKAGTGTLTLTGTNTYTGSTFLNGGVTSIGAATALGAPTATATLTLNGGTLQATNSFTLAGGGAANYVLIGGGGGTFNVAVGSNLSITAAISNLAANQFGPLTKTGAGTLTLTGSNSYGGATIIRGGVLSTNLLANGSTNVGTTFTTNNSSIGAAPNVANALILDGGTLQYTGPAVSTDRGFTLTNNGGALDSSGSGALAFTQTNPGLFTGTGARTLTLTGSAGTAAASNVLAAPILDGAGGSTSLSKTGAGAWQLTSAGNTFTGGTTVTGGNLSLVNAGTNNSIASSPTISVSSGATLGTSGLQGGGIGLANGQTLTGGGTVSGGVTANTGSSLTPGDNGVGTMTVGSLNLNTGSVLNFEFGAGSNDLINDLGALSLNGTGIGLNVLAAGTQNKFTTAGTYTLFNFLSETGSPTADFSILNPATGLTYAFNLTGTALQLVISGQAAVTSTWNNTGGGTWMAPANWDNNTVPNAAGGTAIFGSKITAPSTVTLDGNKTVGEVDFNSTNSYTVSTGAPATSTLVLNNGGTGAVLKDLTGNHTISAPISMVLGTTAAVSPGATLTLSGPVANTGAAGTGVLTKAGAGTLALLGANTYADGTVITGGTVQINSAASLGATTGVATLNSSGAPATLEALSSIVSARNFALTGAANNFQVDGAGVFELDGVAADGAAGGGGLTKTGTGTLALTNANTYSGGTTISAGTLSLGAGGATGSVTGTITDNANLTFNGTDNPTVGNVIAGTGSLTQAGADNVTLNGTDTFTGLTTIANGATLTTGNALALQNSTLLYNTGTLSFGALTAATLGGLSGGQALALTNAAATPAAVALSVGNNNQATTFSGGLSGAGSSLTKNGIGTLTLTGANTYTGATNLFGGGLTLSTGGSIGSAATPAGAFISGNASGQFLINGGSIVSGGASTFATGGGGLLMTSGAANFTAGITTTSAGGDGLDIEVDGGSFTTNGLSLARNASYLTLPVTSAAIANNGFYSTGGTSSLGALTISNAATNSSGSAKINGGAVTATVVNVGLNATGRYSVLNVNAGSFTATDTVTGIGLSPFAAATTFGGTNAELLLTGGTTTTPLVTFGTATTATGTGTLTLAAPAGSNAFLYLGNTAAPGGVGLSEPAAPATFASTINLTNGTVGAAADWTAAVPMTLGTTTFQASDAGGAAHNITLTGVLGGAGSLTKTGGGTLTLTGANSYNLGTTINAGTLNINGVNALGGGNYTGTTFNGGTLQYAANSGAFTANGSGDISGIGATPEPVTINAGGATIDTNGNTVTFANPIGNSGVGGLTLNDTATTKGGLTLNGVNTYTGNTTVTAGTLSLVNGTSANTIASSPTITVAGGATLNTSGLQGGGIALVSGQKLTGVGTVTGVTDNGIIDPGTIGVPGSTGTLTVGGLTLSSGSVLNFDLSGASTDLLTDTGAFTFTGTGAATVSFNIGSPLTASSYTFANLGTGTVLSSEFSFTNPTGYTAKVSGNNLVLTMNAVTPTTTATTYTLAASAGASRIITGTSTGITSTITNTGTGTADTLTFTGLGAIPATGAGASGGPLAPGASSSNTGLTFTGGALGNQTVTAVVGTATNTALGTAATQSGAAGTATVDVVGNRTVSATGVNFGRFILGGAVANQTSTLSSATGDRLTDADLTVKNGAIGTDSTNGATITATSGSGQTFDGTNGTGTLTVSKTGTFSSAGLLSGTVTLSGNSSNFAGELTGQTLNPISVAYSANPVNNRTLTASTINFGNTRLGAPFTSGATSLSSTGTNATTANLTVNANATATDGKVTLTGGPAVTFNGSNNTNGDTLLAGANFTAAGAQSGTVTLAASNFTGELAGQTISPLTVAYTGNAYTGTETYVGTGGTYATGGSNAAVQAQWSQGGAPGIDAGFTGVDTVTFGNSVGTSKVAVTLDGVSPSLNAVTFATGSGGVTIAQGMGAGTVTMAGTTPKITNTSGTNAITAPVAFSSAGTITVSGGSLGLGQVSGASATTVSLAGGTTLTLAPTVAAASPDGRTTTKVNDTLGALTVTGGVATLDFGAGNTGEIFTFTGTSAANFGGTLDIINYTGNSFTPPNGAAAGDGFDQLFFAPGTVGQLTNVVFVNPNGLNASFNGRLLATGEVVAPEPSQIVSLGLGLLGIGLLGARTWRKSKNEAVAEAA